MGPSAKRPGVREAPRAAYRAEAYLEAGCGMVLSKAPEGWPPEDPLGAAGALCPAPLGEALGEPPALVPPTTPVGAAPGDAVAAPDGTLFEDSGALWLELGEGGDCVAPAWASAGPGISPALSIVAANAVRMALCKMELPGWLSSTSAIGQRSRFRTLLTSQAAFGSPGFGPGAKICCGGGAGPARHGLPLKSVQRCGKPPRRPVQLSSRLARFPSTAERGTPPCPLAAPSAPWPIAGRPTN